MRQNNVSFQGVFRAALLGIFLISGTALAAATPQQTLKDIFECQLRQHELLARYHIFSSDAGDPVYRSDLQKGQSEAAACVGALENNLKALGLPREASDMRLKYNMFSLNLSQNLAAIAKRGAPENEVQSVMIQGELDLQTSLERALKNTVEATKYKLNPQVDRARRLAVMLQYANARYLERTTSAYSVSRDDSNEPTIDELARRFGKELEELRKGTAARPDVAPMLATVVTKWRFIEGSLLNYNDKTVPFTVNRHARSIQTLLGEIADKLEAGK